MTKFDKIGAATLQLSTEQKSFVFDCVSLQESQKFKDFIYTFFADEKIEKIGHSFTGDIQALNQTFGIKLVRDSDIPDVLGVQQHH